MTNLNENGEPQAEDPLACSRGENKSRNLKAEDDIEIHDSEIARILLTPITKAKRCCKVNASVLKIILIVLFVIFKICFMIAALLINFRRATPMLVMFSLVITYRIYGLIRDTCGEDIWTMVKPIYRNIPTNAKWLKWIGIIIVIVLIGLFVGLDVSKRPYQLISAVGYTVFVFCLWAAASKYPTKVRWRPVIWGFGLQIALAALILRVNVVFQFFNGIGFFVKSFLNYVNDGAKFVFGDLYYEHFFAFKILSTVIYFSAFISVLYYLGGMQWLILRFAWIMQFTMGTSGTESMVAAGNIFLGMTESPLLILPYLEDVTTSELFSIMTAGLATVAGSVMGAYLGYGIKPVYVVTAGVMAAPCGLALSKLMHPETKVGKFKKMEGLKLDPPDQRNVIEAAFVGASAAVPLALNIAANLIAFLSLLAALNGFLSWYGGLVNYPQLSFETICSYLFLPVTFMMGIDWDDCFKCAELLGVKTFLNEFVAYERLSPLIKNNGTLQKFNEDGSINWINDRSEAIITYALCGFANFGSVGITLGGLGSLCPSRQKHITKYVLRALLAGCFVNILNACVAGLFYLPDPNCEQLYESPSWNGTVDYLSLHTCCENTFITTLPQPMCPSVFGMKQPENWWKMPDKINENDRANILWNFNIRVDIRNVAYELEPW